MPTPAIVRWLLSKPTPREACPPRRPGGDPQRHPACLSRQGQGGCRSGSAFPAAALIGAPRRCANRSPPAGRDCETGRMMEDGCGRGPPRFSAGFGRAMERQIRGRGKRLTAAAAPGRGGSAMVAWGSSPGAHIRTNPVSCRLCRGPPALCGQPPLGVRSTKIQENSISVFGCGPGTFLPASGSRESEARGFRKIEFS